MLTWREVKSILQQTATNMPGRESWEVGAGYVNSYAAVTMAANLRTDYGATETTQRDFNAGLVGSNVKGPDFELTFNPVGEQQTESFVVSDEMSTVTARAVVEANTVALVLRDPNGNRYGSSIALPVLGEVIGVTAPAVPGTWTVELGGVGSVSGVAFDPLGVTNGYAVPLSPVNVGINFFRVDSYTNIGDVQGHPAQGFVEVGINELLLDGRANGYEPDALLTRGELAEYLTLGGNIRQFRATDGSSSFMDTAGEITVMYNGSSKQKGKKVPISESMEETPILEAAAEAVTARGAAQRDVRQTQNGVMMAVGDKFNPGGNVSREELAYSLVQSLGLEAEAEAARIALENEPITASNGDERVALSDDADIDPALRGYVQLALDLQLMRPSFSLSQGPFDLTPTLSATFDGSSFVDRGTFAFNAVNLLDRLNQSAE